MKYNLLDPQRKFFNYLLETQELSCTQDKEYKKLVKNLKNTTKFSEYDKTEDKVDQFGVKSDRILDIKDIDLLINEVEKVFDLEKDSYRKFITDYKKSDNDSLAILDFNSINFHIDRICSHSSCLLFVLTSSDDYLLRQRLYLNDTENTDMEYEGYSELFVEGEYIEKSVLLRPGHMIHFNDSILHNVTKAKKIYYTSVSELDLVDNNSKYNNTCIIMPHPFYMEDKVYKIEDKIKNKIIMDHL